MASPPAALEGQVRRYDDGAGPGRGSRHALVRDAASIPLGRRRAACPGRPPMVPPAGSSGGAATHRRARSRPHGGVRAVATGGVRGRAGRQRCASALGHMPHGHPLVAFGYCRSTSVTSVLPEGPCLVRSVTCSPPRSPLRRSPAVLPAFAADEPVLTGTVVDAAGEPFPVENGTLTMTAPDGGGIYGTQVSVGGDGSFEVEVMPWGTDATPAEVTISITGVVGDTEVNAGCTDQFAPVAESTFQVALESNGEPEPVVLVAEERLIGTVCGEGSSRDPCRRARSSRPRRPRARRRPWSRPCPRPRPGARGGRTSRAGRRQRRARMARGSAGRGGSGPRRARRMARALPPLARLSPAQPDTKLSRTVRVALSAFGSSRQIDCHVPSAIRPPTTGTVSVGAASSGTRWSAP